MCRSFCLHNVDFATGYFHREFRMPGGLASDMETLYFYRYRERHADILRFCLENDIRYNASIPTLIPANIPDMLDLLSPSVRCAVLRRNRASTPYRRTDQ